MTRQSSSDSSGLVQSGAGETGTLALLRKIESGTVDANAISVSDRRQLVAFLVGDGYPTAELAQVLKVADRTIERDKKAIRESNAIVRDPKLVGELVGRLVCEAELAVQRIRKAVRAKKTSPAVRIDGEQRCYQIVSDLVRSMQRLGYLPTAAQKVEADLTHHVGEVPEFHVMHAEVQRIKQICQDSDGEVPSEVTVLESQIVQADLASRVDEVSAQVERQNEEGDDDE